jgi:hypothetical protein
MRGRPPSAPVLARDDDITRLATTERPIIAPVLDEDDGEVLPAEAEIPLEELGEATEEGLLHLGRPTAGQDDLDEDPTIRSRYLEIGRIEAEMLRIVLSDDLESIAFRDAERLDESQLDVVSQGRKLLASSPGQELDTNKRHALTSSHCATPRA